MPERPLPGRAARALGVALAAGALCPAARALSYVDSSTGLSTPQWERGLTELEFADVNRDGRVDIVSIGDHGNPGIGSGEHGLMVWFGDGAGAWSHFQTGEFGYGGIAIGDLNGDGTPDAAYAMHHNYSGADFGDQLIEAALGDGSGRTWTPWDDGLAGGGEDYGMFATNLADVDNDGDLDLASLSFGCCNGIHAYLNEGAGVWRHSFEQWGGNSTTNELVFGDVNADGYADMAAGFQYGTVWLGDGFGGFTLADGNLPGTGILGRTGPDLADVNRDGRQDLSFVNTAGGVEVWLWSGAGAWTKASTGLPATGSYDTTQMDDMNADGSMDVAACGNGTVTVWTGDGGTGWVQATSFTIGNPGGCSAFRVGGDGDHNGRPDIGLVEDEYISMFTTRNRAKFYRESSPAGPLSIRATYPRGGEVLAEGSVRFVEWASSVPAGASTRVGLELSISGGGGPWTSIAEDLPDNGRYQWSVPVGTVSANCLIRYTVTSATAEKEVPGEAPDLSTTSVTMAAFSIIAPDADGDGVADREDCAPLDPGSTRMPVEVSALRVRPDPSDPAARVLAGWDSQAPVSGPGTVHDLVAGPASDLGPDGLLDQAFCAGDDEPDTSASVTLPAAAGSVHYLLVRAENACGAGPWGSASSGQPRSCSACP